MRDGAYDQVKAWWHDGVSWQSQDITTSASKKPKAIICCGGRVAFWVDEYASQLYYGTFGSASRVQLRAD